MHGQYGSILMIYLLQQMMGLDYHQGKQILEVNSMHNVLLQLIIVA